MKRMIVSSLSVLAIFAAVNPVFAMTERFEREVLFTENGNDQVDNIDQENRIRTGGSRVEVGKLRQLC